MVDWKSLGKQALDTAKDVSQTVAEKGKEEYQDWKNDPERLERKEAKKEDKIEQKREEKALQQQARAEKKNFKTIKTTIAIDGSSYRKIKRGATKIYQERAGYLTFKGFNREVKLLDITISDKQGSTGASIFGAVIAGTPGAVIGSTFKSHKYYGMIKVQLPNGEIHAITYHTTKALAPDLYRMTPYSD